MTYREQRDLGITLSISALLAGCSYRYDDWPRRGTLPECASLETPTAWFEVEEFDQRWWALGLTENGLPIPHDAVVSVTAEALVFDLGVELPDVTVGWHRAEPAPFAHGEAVTVTAFHDGQSLGMLLFSALEGTGRLLETRFSDPDGFTSGVHDVVVEAEPACEYRDFTQLPDWRWDRAFGRSSRVTVDGVTLAFDAPEAELPPAESIGGVSLANWIGSSVVSRRANDPEIVRQGARIQFVHWPTD